MADTLTTPMESPKLQPALFLTFTRITSQHHQIRTRRARAHHLLRGLTRTMAPDHLHLMGVLFLKLDKMPVVWG